MQKQSTSLTVTLTNLFRSIRLRYMMIRYPHDMLKEEMTNALHPEFGWFWYPDEEGGRLCARLEAAESSAAANLLEVNALREELAKAQTDIARLSTELNTTVAKDAAKAARP